MFAIIQTVSTWPQASTRLTIDNVSIVPATSALFWWHLKTSDGAEMQSGALSLTGDAYAAWGTDDDYLYTYTATALGLTIVEIVPDAPPAPPLPDMSVPPMADAPVAPAPSND
jgi:hypothetical protein